MVEDGSTPCSGSTHRVAGGSWWPLGIGDEAWSNVNRRAHVDCPAELGPHRTIFETHELGPNPAAAEATVIHYAVPAWATADLRGRGQGWPTSYCMAGGARTIRRSVNGGSAPYLARVNGVAAEMNYSAEYRTGDGSARVSCADWLGLLAMMIEVWVESEPTNRIVFPVLLMAVEEHPSGLPWSEFE